MLRHPGLVLGMARFYYSPRASVRGMIESGPSEARLLAYAIIAATILLLGRLTSLAAAVPDDFLARAMAESVSMLFFVPLAYYLLAAIGTLLARAFKGDGSWPEGRAAFFWAALVSAPVMVMCGLLPMVLPGPPRIASALINQFGQVYFAWAVAQCFAVAFHFTRPWAVFVVIATPALVWIAIALALR